MHILLNPALPALDGQWKDNKGSLIQIPSTLLASLKDHNLHPTSQSQVPPRPYALQRSKVSPPTGPQLHMACPCPCSNQHHRRLHLQHYLHLPAQVAKDEATPGSHPVSKHRAANRTILHRSSKTYLFEAWTNVERVWGGVRSVAFNVDKMIVKKKIVCWRLRLQRAMNTKCKC